MRVIHLGLMGMVLFPMVRCPAARAQAKGSDTGAATAPQSSPAPGDPAQDAEIVVTANRYYGEASVASETEFGEGEIANQGADNIQQLLDRLAPFIDPSGEEPVLLINGKPADGDRSILSYPTEALNRIAVLKPGAATQYGYAPGRRVVNLVLKKHFASITADAGVSGATAGGAKGGMVSVGRVAIDGPMRWNVLARIDLDGALRRSERNLPPRAGTFDAVGYVARADGAELDPALSAGAGEVVTLAAIPWQATSQPPVLADFAALANRRNPIDPDDFETLQPSRRRMSLAAGVTRPIGAFSATLSLAANSTESKGLRGIPMASLVLPAGGPWSPFASDVALTRPFDGLRPLRNDNRSQSLGLSLSLAGQIGGWRIAFSANYTRNWTDGLLEGGIDTGQVQARIDAGDPAFNPYGRWDRSLLLANRTHSEGDNIASRVSATKAIVDLPAGPLTLNLSANINRATSTNTRGDSAVGGMLSSRQNRSRFEGQFSFNVPLSRRGKGEIGPLGDLSVDLLAGGQAMSGASFQRRLGGGFTWSPVSAFQLRGTVENVENAPTSEQLDGPLIQTINRIFDYSRQEVVDAIWITGGNPGLGRGRRQGRTLSAMIRPFNDQALTLNIGYSGQVAKGGIASFPELTPVIEAAFPERVTRDAAGHIVAVDARPFNIVRESSADLTSGVALRLPQRSAGQLRTGTANPVQWGVSVTHRWRLESELLTRAGVPLIDQLGGDSGQSRHSVSLQATAGKRGMGATLNANWNSAAHLRRAASSSGGTAQNYRFAPTAIFNLSFFVEPEQVVRGVAKQGWLKDVKLSIDIRNLLNGYRRVRLADGSTPFGYGRDEIDPLGRTVRIALRKRF